MSLEARILAAFANVPRPAVIAPHACPECDDLAQALAPHAPSSLPDTVFARHVWDLPLLSDEAKQYYLPAWLLRASAPDGGSACDALVFALESDHRWSPEPPYTEDQWLVIDAVLAQAAAGSDRAVAEDIDRARRCIPR